jgi:hypothetical protein
MRTRRGACGPPHHHGTTTARIVDIFTGVARSRLYREGGLVQTFDPELTPVQRDVLTLLNVPLTNQTTG